jgi:ABC-type nickel/cobalt efflux system permease component RcnA
VLGLDELIAGLGGGSVALALAVAVLLGLRHATDPDHLTAVSTLVMSDERGGALRATLLGLAWGAGHAVTLVALGLPVVVFSSALPNGVQQAAEVAIGAVIVGLAVRLLVRWRRGYFHAHPHSHGDVMHAHPHVHERAHDHVAAHEHGHPASLGRSPVEAFGIGLLHGVGGSAGVGILLVAGASSEVVGFVGLVLFALASAVSMAAFSSGFGYALARGPLLDHVRAAVPVLGAGGVAFGAWYALATLGTLPYPF